MTIRANTTKSFQFSKQPLDFISFLVQLFIVLPRGFTITFWRHNRRKPQARNQSPSLATFIRPVHNDGARIRSRTQRHKQLAAFSQRSLWTASAGRIFELHGQRVMLWYSARLTLTVAISIPVHIILPLLYTPILRARLHESNGRNNWPRMWKRQHFVFFLPESRLFFRKSGKF